MNQYRQGVLDCIKVIESEAMNGVLYNESTAIVKMNLKKLIVNKYKCKNCRKISECSKPTIYINCPCGGELENY